MFKKIRNEPLAILAIVLMLGVAVIAAKPGGITGLTSLWVGDQTDTAAFTPGVDDMWVVEDFGFGGTFYAPAESVDATAIANVTRDIYLPMAGWVVESPSVIGDIDESSSPELTIVDNVPAIVWGNSGEVSGILQTLRTPSDYVSGFIIYCLISSDTANSTAASNAIDWEIWDNYDDAGFDLVAVPQDTVVATSSTLNASCEVLTLEPDETAEAMITAGHFYTIKLFNATTHVSANMELKGVHVVYTAKQ